MSTTPCERCEDFSADASKVLSQRCAPDERHCSCVPHLRAEIDRLTAELEEARLTLAAEQGHADGAPSEGWTCERIHRGRPTWLRRAIIQGYDGTFYVEYAPIGIDGWFWCFQSPDVQTTFQPANTARAAMRAADASK